MTKQLATLLGALQPTFGLFLRELERVHGHPSHDIRLTSDNARIARQKIQALGLDPTDTTAEELYRALSERLLRDDAVLRQAIGLPLGAAMDDVGRTIRRKAQETADSVEVFALKPAVVRRLLRKLQPKRTMKLLGYRSLESLLKHEPLAAVVFAARMHESVSWQKQLLSAYGQLTAQDFEQRHAAVLLLTSQKWQAFNERILAQNHRLSAIVAEAGTVVVCVPPKELPGFSIATLTLLLAELNTLRSICSFLKLHQVSINFGDALRQVVSEPRVSTAAVFGEKHVPWEVIHRYYARHEAAYNPLLFEPHVRSGELAWHEPTAILVHIHEALAFWQDTLTVAVVLGDKRVSFNIYDVAVNTANQLPFNSRTGVAFSEAMWHELMLRYMNLAHVESALRRQLALSV